jgi:hypothetical protein
MFRNREADMHRGYYGFKALLIGMALFAAVLGGGVEVSNFSRTHNSNYQAASEAQATLVDAGIKVRNAVGHFVSCALAGL